MAFLLWIAVFLILQVCNSYILLTANLDDVQALATQISHSPVAGQINTIIRRASTLFNQQLRANDHAAGGQPRYPRTNPDLDSSVQLPLDNLTERRNQDEPHSQTDYRRDKTDVGTGQAEAAENQGMEAKSEETSNMAEEEKDIVEPGNDRRSGQYTEEGASTNETLEVSTNTKKSSEEVNDGQKEESEQKDERRMNMDQMDGLRSKYVERRSQTDEVIQLGKNASLYLNSIKKIIENV